MFTSTDLQVLQRNAVVRDVAKRLDTINLPIASGNGRTKSSTEKQRIKVAQRLVESCGSRG